MDVLQSARGHKNAEGLGACELWEGERATVVQPGDQKAQDKLHVCKHLLDGEEKCEARDLAVPNDRPRGNRHNFNSC